MHKVKGLIILGLLVGAGFILNQMPFHFGLDLQGGMHLILEAQDSPKRAVDQDAVLGAMAVIRNRVDGLGIAEPIVRTKGERQIVVELPGIRDAARAKKMIGDTALLEFINAEWAPSNVSGLSRDKLKVLAGENARISTYNITNERGVVVEEKAIILKDTVMTGGDLKTALPGTDEYGNPVVNIEFTAKGAKIFEQVTSESIGKPLAIILDGTVISAPRIRQAIAGGRAVISGQFSVSEMRDLVIKLKAGALPVPVKIISEKFVGPTLGKDAIQKSLRAGLIGCGLVALLMIAVYRLSGVMSVIALCAYLTWVAAAFKGLDATLTLPGIAGLILTMGMAVDANVIIFERMKEEIRNGHTPLKAIENGFSRAFVTILDANITTLIAAIVLFWLGTGSIKGFAVSLSIGILVSMFSAIWVTRFLLDVAVRLGFAKWVRLVGVRHG